MIDFIQPSLQPTQNGASYEMGPGDTDDALLQAVQAACRRIAPTWPLDRFIAVNPWWGFIDQPVQAASDSIGHLSGSPLTMPMEWYLNEYDKGLITQDALGVALERHGLKMGADTFRRTCPAESKQPERLTLLTDVIDEQRDLVHQPACKDVVIHAIGQHCASWFDQGQARWKPTHATSLYAAWREIASHDNGPSLLTGINGIAGRIAALPAKHDELIRVVCEKLKIDKDDYESYFTALLLSVNGWSAWCAYLNWQALQQGQADNHLQQLLAIRLGWEWVLADGTVHDALISDWRTTSRTQRQKNVNSIAWVWQEALEISWQREVNQGLLIPQQEPPEQPTRPALQAVFCIDVRSERMRRALEKSSPTIRTHGFAGFFGLPIDYLPFGGRQAQPQLSGLLAPKLHAVTRAVNPTLTQNLLEKRRFKLGISQAWEGFRTAASSGFGFVETIGISYAWKLVAVLVTGQLGSMLQQAGQRIGIDVHLLNIEKDRLPEVETPITAEREHWPLNSFTEALQRQPGWLNSAAFSALSNRTQQKALLDQLGLPTAPWCVMAVGMSQKDLHQQVGPDIFLKRASGGYDGRGQLRLKEGIVSDLPAWADNAIAEQAIRFESEVSIIGARAGDGQTVYYRLTENRHDDGVLTISLSQPYRFDALQSKAEKMLGQVMQHLDYVGVMAMECFIVDGQLLINEIAPRVHNSGHWTQAGASISQFELHLRAVCGLPLHNRNSLAVA